MSDNSKTCLIDIVDAEDFSTSVKWKRWRNRPNLTYFSTKRIFLKTDLRKLLFWKKSISLSTSRIFSKFVSNDLGCKYSSFLPNSSAFFDEKSTLHIRSVNLADLKSIRKTKPKI